MPDHDQRPKPGSLSEAEVGAVLATIPAGYRNRVGDVGRQLQGKLVAGSRAGRSGYALLFTDGTAALVFVEDGRMELRTLAGAPSPEELALLDQPGAGDGSVPSNANLPNASAPCLIPVEVAHCHGQAVTGVAIGSDCFSLCFPAGRELEGMFVPDPTGKPALRVFWEQW